MGTDDAVHREDCHCVSRRPETEEIDMERRIVNPWKWQDQYGFVQANEVSGARSVLYCSGQVPTDAEGSVIGAGDMRAQVTQALDNLDTLLRAAGFELSHVVRLNLFTTDMNRAMENWPQIQDRLAKAGCRQASTLLGVAQLYHPEVLVEIEATAVR
jgi:enamine deaminase RidA (YjgF/YER057c/UK114 family)